MFRLAKKTRHVRVELVRERHSCSDTEIKETPQVYLGGSIDYLDWRCQLVLGFGDLPPSKRPDIQDLPTTTTGIVRGRSRLYTCWHSTLGILDGIIFRAEVFPGNIERVGRAGVLFAYIELRNAAMFDIGYAHPICKPFFFYFLPHAPANNRIQFLGASEDSRGERVSRFDRRRVGAVLPDSRRRFLVDEIGLSTNRCRLANNATKLKNRPISRFHSPLGGLDQEKCSTPLRRPITCPNA